MANKVSKKLKRIRDMNPRELVDRLSQLAGAQAVLLYLARPKDIELNMELRLIQDELLKRSLKASLITL